MTIRYDFLVLGVLLFLSIIFNNVGFELIATLLLVLFGAMIVGVIIRLYLIKYDYPVMWVRVFHPSKGVDPDNPLNIGKPLELNGYLLATHHLDGAAYDTALQKYSKHAECKQLTALYIKVKPKHTKFITFKGADPITRESFDNGFGLTFLIKQTDVLVAFKKNQYQYMKPKKLDYWKPSVLIVILAGYLTAGSGSYDIHYQKKLHAR